MNCDAGLFAGGKHLWVIPNVLLLLAGTVVPGVLAARRFRYQ